EIVVGIGESGTGFARVRRLAAVGVGIPSRLGDRLQLFLQRIEGGIDKARLEALLKRLAPQLHWRHAFADIGRRQVRAPVGPEQHPRASTCSDFRHPSGSYFYLSPQNRMAALVRE